LVPALEELEAEIDAAFADAAFTADWIAGLPITPAARHR